MEANEQATFKADKPLIDFSWDDCVELFSAHEDEKFFSQDLH